MIDRTYCIGAVEQTTEAMASRSIGMTEKVSLVLSARMKGGNGYAAARRKSSAE